MPLQLDPYQSPYAGRMADLLMEQGRIRAAGALADANTGARGLQIVGRTMGDLLEAPRVLQQAQMKDASQRMGLERDALDLQAARQKQEDGQAFSRLIVSSLRPTADGHVVYDIPALTEGIKNHPNLGQHAPDLLASARNANEAYAKFSTDKNATKVDALAAIAFSTYASRKKTVDDLQVSSFPFVGSGAVTPEDVQKLTDDFNRAGPDQRDTLLKSYINRSEKAKAELHALQPKPATTDYERYVTRREQELGRPLTSAEELQSRKDFEIATRPPKDPVPKSLQSVPGLLRGKEAFVNHDPATGHYLDPATGDDVSAVFKPMPPASERGGGAGAGSGGTVLVDRPTEEAANKIDPKTGLTPNSRWQLSSEFAMKGVMPSLGLGARGTTAAKREAIINDASARVAAAGVDLPTLQAEYKANAITLNKMVPQYNAMAAFEETAKANLQLAVEKSAQVGRTGAKFVNRYLQWAQGELTAAKGLTQLETYVYTAAREYAKVTSGGALSAAGLTDSASKEASRLLSAAQAPESFAAAAEAMVNDMDNAKGKYGEQIAKVSDTIARFLGVPASAAGAQSPQSRAGAGGPNTDQNRTVTEAELAAIARTRGTTVEQERQRARAAGYLIR